MSETNIVALHDHIPQQQQRISLVPHSSFARGRHRLNNQAFQKGRRRTKSEDFFFLACDFNPKQTKKKRFRFCDHSRVRISRISLEMPLKIRTTLRVHVFVLRENLKLENQRDRADAMHREYTVGENAPLDDCFQSEPISSLFNFSAHKQQHINAP